MEERGRNQTMGITGITRMRGGCRGSFQKGEDARHREGRTEWR